VAIQPGQQLAHYRLVEKIGEGGMGVVWRATDTSLDRDVAIKLLPEGFAANLERLQRFEREAKLLASLNHPHIATIHGLHEAGTPEGPVRFLAMELVEGEDLTQQIERGAIPIERVIEIATQVAEALDAAHSQGVIHRDLKPANVKLTADGQAKVLDFGLAKALTGEPASSDPRVGPTLSPTITSMGTAAGMILGTAAYMSPEQARGKPVDKRTDLWAFGCLLYEMLAGRRVYGGETISDTLASVLKEQPDWAALDEDTPPAVRRLLRRCLTKDPRQRLGDAAAARLELREAFDPPHPGEQFVSSVEAVPSSQAVTRRALPWAVAVASVLVTLVILFSRSGGDASTAGPLNLSVALPHGVQLEDDQSSNLDISPDGRFLVFSGLVEGNRRLYLRELGSAEATPIAESVNALNPFFSPDGRWIAFFSEGKIKKVSVTGGTPVTICDATGSPRGASWGADDLIVFPRHFDGALLQVSGSGGEPTPLTELDESRKERTHRWPQIVPGHDVVLFTVATTDSPEFYDDARIDAVRLGTGERKTVFEGASFARYVETGHLVFGREGLLFAVPFDIDQLTATGASLPVVEGVMGARTSGAVYASIAQNGLLAYLEGTPTTRRATLNWHYLDGRTEPAGAPVDGYIDPVISPDGRTIAVSISGDSGKFDIWTYDIARRSSTRLTFEGSNTIPVWTPDGTSLAYYSIRDGLGAAYLKAADGSGEDRLFHSIEGNSTNIDDISADGRFATLSVYGSKKSDVYIKPLDDPDADAVPFAAGPGDEGRAHFSPDGRWVAYTSDETGDYEVFVRPYPGPGGRWQISTEGGIHPRWSQDGRRLFYRIGRRLMVADVETGDGQAFRAGSPRMLLDDLPRSQLSINYDLDHEGQAVLIADPQEDYGPPDRITVVVNWFDELERLVPSGL
jgi:serine/threonine-protein kinase